MITKIIEESLCLHFAFLIACLLDAFPLRIVERSALRLNKSLGRGKEFPLCKAVNIQIKDSRAVEVVDVGPVRLAERVKARFLRRPHTNKQLEFKALRSFK